MKNRLILCLALFAMAPLWAHPHFTKSLTVDLPGNVKATVTYTTVPSNEAHAHNAEVGSFVTPRAPQLTLSADLQAGGVTIPQGTYTIGVVKKGAEEWILALYPGRLGRGESPDASKLIRLESQFSASHGNAEHLRVDVNPGHGSLEGRVVLTVDFGSLSCSGALS